MECQFCNSENIKELGLLGAKWYVRCCDCGMDSSIPEDVMFDDSEEPFERANRRAIEELSAEYEEPFICEDDRDLDFMDEEYQRDDDEEPEWDGQPSEWQEWHDFDPDC